MFKIKIKEPSQDKTRIISSPTRSTSPSPDLFFEMANHPVVNGFSSKLTINLTTYLVSFKQNPELHRTLHHTLSEQLTGMNAEFLWTNILNHALQGALKPDEHRIRRSSLIKLMKKHFCELVKNLIDECILNYLDISYPRILTLAMFIKIDDNNIHLVFKDNGRGFSSQFLTETRAENQQVYLAQVGSLKQHQNFNPSNTPTLFGGAGKGLRHLMNDVLRLSNLDAISNLSSIGFQNQEATSGAIIEITAPLKPSLTVRIPPPPPGLEFPFLVRLEDDDIPEFVPHSTEGTLLQATSLEEKLLNSILFCNLDELKSIAQRAPELSLQPLPPSVIARLTNFNLNFIDVGEDLNFIELALLLVMIENENLHSRKIKGTEATSAHIPSRLRLHFYTCMREIVVPFCSMERTSDSLASREHLPTEASSQNASTHVPFHNLRLTFFSPRPAPGSPAEEGTLRIDTFIEPNSLP